MNFIDKLERRFGRYGIPNLMRYVIVANAIGFALNMVAPTVYSNYLNLDVYQILHGQVWRLVTFVLCPPSFFGGGTRFMMMLFFVVWMYVYYSVGSSLEQAWGTFRFSFFYLGGIALVIVITFAAYFILCGVSGAPSVLVGMYMAYGVTLEYLNDSLFLAFALMFPMAQFLIYFVVPVKAKWLAILWLLLDGYYVFVGIRDGDYFTVALIIGSLLNVAVFFLFGRGRPGVQGAYRQRKRKVQYRRKVQEATPGGTIHRCAICGRTERDVPAGTEFRYCSKCEGNYEYCSEHLFTHEHVHR